MNSIYPVASINKCRDAMENVLRTFYQNRELLLYYGSTKRDKKITVQTLCDLAANHLFDDCPSMFGITKSDGHNIRTYFQVSHAFYCNFVHELHREFPEFMDSEDPEYIDRHVNEFRIRNGLWPFLLPFDYERK